MFECECDNPYLCDFQQGCDNERGHKIVKRHALSSSVVEQPPCKRQVGGSSPSESTNQLYKEFERAIAGPQVG